MTDQPSSTTRVRAGHHPRHPAGWAAFRATVMEHYHENGRDLPWRHTHDPYLILVSEIMLQQTQVARVLEKYETFRSRFPTVVSLAEAPTSDVLAVWQGLGYNRRALNLQKSARIIVEQHSGRVPATLPELVRLPGVGPATAAAVCAFAFGIALPFLETNIRSVYIHHFFQECSRVSDADILPLVEATLDRENPRDWYYALMDYGSSLKKTHPNPSRRSSHARRQPAFEGSHRQLRACLLRIFLDAWSSGGAAEGATAPRQRTDDAGSAGRLDIDVLYSMLPERDRAEIQRALEELLEEGFLGKAEDGGYNLV